MGHIHSTAHRHADFASASPVILGVRPGFGVIGATIGRIQARPERPGGLLRLPVMAPMETVDLGELDLTQAIQSYLLAELDRSTEPALLINDKVARGELGAKAGKGFYDWPEGQLARTIQRRDTALIEMVAWLRDGGYLEGV